CRAFQERDGKNRPQPEAACGGASIHIIHQHCGSLSFECKLERCCLALVQSPDWLQVDDGSYLKPLARLENPVFYLLGRACVDQFIADSDWNENTPKQAGRNIRAIDQY